MVDKDKQYYQRFEVDVLSQLQRAPRLETDSISPEFLKKLKRAPLLAYNYADAEETDLACKKSDKILVYIKCTESSSYTKDSSSLDLEFWKLIDKHSKEPIAQRGDYHLVFHNLEDVVALRKKMATLISNSNRTGPSAEELSKLPAGKLLPLLPTVKGYGMDADESTAFLGSDDNRWIRFGYGFSGSYSSDRSLAWLLFSPPYSIIPKYSDKVKIAIHEAANERVAVVDGWNTTKLIAAETNLLGEPLDWHGWDNMGMRMTRD